ncbi:MAG TPA: hypothetical protein VN457_04070 [Chlamydiales bacterium]|nr:hypothetical protein [Chlamydiales bacterium]
MPSSIGAAGIAARAPQIDQQQQIGQPPCQPPSEASTPSANPSESLFMQGVWLIYGVACSTLHFIVACVIDCASWVADWTRYRIARFVVTSIGRTAPEIAASENEDVLRDCKLYQLHFERCTQRTQRDEVELAGFTLTHYRNKTNWIVLFPSHDKLWQDELQQLIALAYETKTNVCCFNYRGAGGSSGELHSEIEAIRDGREIVEGLITKTKIAAKNIMVAGREFGGQVAALTCGALHTIGKKVHLMCEDTAPSFTQWTQRANWYGRISAALFSYFGWQLNIQPAIRQMVGDAKVLLLTRQTTATQGEIAQLKQLRPTGIIHQHREDNDDRQAAWVKTVNNIKEIFQN